MRRPERALLLAGLLLAGVGAQADGVIIDTVYHPYVEAGERELEWRSVFQDATPILPVRTSVHRLAYGQAIGDRWFVEGYLVGEDRHGEYQDLEAVEIEALHQLTEQGEYWADWGVVLELERELDLNAWEASIGLLGEKELGRFSVAANLFLIQEWGSDILDELETRLAMQARYRLQPAFEPALELHAGENTRAVGPAATGRVRLAAGRRISWSAAMLFGLDADSPDQAFRFEVEYEF